MSRAIVAKMISKRYRLGVKEQMHDSLADAFMSLIRYPLTSYRRLRQLTHFDGDEASVLWALKDVSFELNQGDVLGIIGKNGAGKSTLLKVLARITAPSLGQVDLFGRVNSLLEVGTGFHPELSGRDNIFLNGTILGMTRKEVLSKFDEIVAFSGIERFIDTPVKRYSSGMRVRLAFAVAAHLEPEILIIDEVLAVGDYEFQKKCLGKMDEVSKSGRTVLFVSHNMNAVSNLCNKVMVLKDGEVTFNGGVDEGVGFYLDNIQNFESTYLNNTPLPDLPIAIKKVVLKSAQGTPANSFAFDESVCMDISFEIRHAQRGLGIAFAVVNSNETVVLNSSIFDSNPGLIEDHLEKGEHHFQIELPGSLLNTGSYYLRFFASNNLKMIAYERLDLMWFKITEKGLYPNASKRRAMVIPRLNWKRDA